MLQIVDLVRYFVSRFNPSSEPLTQAYLMSEDDKIVFRHKLSLLEQGE